MGVMCGRTSRPRHVRGAQPWDPAEVVTQYASLGAAGARQRALSRRRFRTSPALSLSLPRDVYDARHWCSITLAGRQRAAVAARDGAQKGDKRSCA